MFRFALISFSLQAYKMSTKQRLFQLNNTEFNQILFCDDSNTEDVLQLDNKDIRFLKAIWQLIKNLTLLTK